MTAKEEVVHFAARRILSGKSSPQSRRLRNIEPAFVRVAQAHAFGLILILATVAVGGRCARQTNGRQDALATETAHRGVRDGGTRFSDEADDRLPLHAPPAMLVRGMRDLVTQD